MTSPRRLAYLGPAGSYSEQACLTYDSDAARLPCESIVAAAAAVDSGEADECIVPIENSLEGPVTLTLDLLIRQSTLFIRNELVMPIKHYLVALKGTRSEDVRVVYSHPQALAQCRSFLSKTFPRAREVASMSTSAAVREMLEHSEGAAAIASRRASEMYGAETLFRGIEDSPNNMTRFVVLAPTDNSPTGDDKTSVCFSFEKDAPGILHSVLGEFAERGISLTKIESRPTKQSLGRYIFLLDLQGHKEDRIVQEALDGAERQVSMFKIFGSYPRSSVPS